jgi:fatty acid desaturase
VGSTLFIVLGGASEVVYYFNIHAIIVDLFLVLFAGFWLFQVSRGIRSSLKRGEKTNWVVAAMGLLVLTGFGGFFTAALAAEGILKLPNSFEWPAGYVEGAKTLPDGKNVVPLEPSGRV